MSGREVDALIHIEEAIQHLGIECEHVSGGGDTVGGHLDSLALELDRIDRALGGKTLLKYMADAIRAAFVELLAARAALQEPRP